MGACTKPLQAGKKKESNERKSGSGRGIAPLFLGSLSQGD
jgi:hypothetical protein